MSSYSSVISSKKPPPRHHLFQRRDLILLGDNSPLRGFVSRVLGRERRTRSMSQINTWARARNSAQRSVKLPCPRVSNRPNGHQVRFAHSSGRNHPRLVRLG